jgi:predicted RNA polymerase sigma factor
LKARTITTEIPILLLDQDRGRWDHLLIRRGLAALARAETIAGQESRGLGSYALQAAIAACHARAPTVARRLAAHRRAYEALAVSCITVIELNRAVAVAMVSGPAAGLALTDRLIDESALKDYHSCRACAGDLLCRLRRHQEAAVRISTRRSAYPQRAGKDLVEEAGEGK